MHLSVTRAKSLAAATLVVSAIAVPVLAAAAPAAAQTKAHAKSTTITVTATDFKFKLSASSLSKPGTVVFKIVNKGHTEHDFAVDGKKSKLIGPGASTSLTVKFTKKGSYYYDCTVPGHAALGMKGHFTVK